MSRFRPQHLTKHSFRRISHVVKLLLFALTLFLGNSFVANAQATQREDAYRLTGTLPFPEYDSYTQFCSLGRCYFGVATQTMAFFDRESACNYVLKARNSNGISYYGNYSGFNDASPNDFFLLSVGSPYTETNGNKYDESQCILRSIKWPGYLDFTLTSRGIFGTIFFPNIRVIPVARCVGHPTVGNYWFDREYIDQICSNSGLTLSLTPVPNQTNPRPAGTGGKSTLDLIARVTEGSTPKTGVAVNFKAEVVPMTGGHGHHDVSRPKGSVIASGVTNASGEIKLTFQASEVAGSHNITATCDSCSNKTVDKKVDVLVPDLQPVSANPPRNPDGTYLYSLTAVDATHVGTSGGRQRGEYYLTQAANQNLRGLIEQFADEGWGTVALNDASLNWGGVYDIFNTWQPPHSEHRLGEEIDISFSRAGNPISQSKQNEFYKKFCEDKKIQVPFSILHHYLKGPHFHVRLVAANRCGKTAK